jgi:hypothetical protein
MVIAKPKPEKPLRGVLLWVIGAGIVMGLLAPRIDRAAVVAPKSAAPAAKQASQAPSPKSAASHLPRSGAPHAAALPAAKPVPVRSPTPIGSPKATNHSTPHPATAASRAGIAATMTNRNGSLTRHVGGPAPYDAKRGAVIGGTVLPHKH